MNNAFPLPHPYLPGDQKLDTFEDKTQQNFDALAIAVGERRDQTQGSTATLSLANGWATQAGHEALKVRRIGSLVVLSGVLNGAVATNVTCSTLAAEYRPAATTRAPNVYYTGAAYAIGPTLITAAGAVQVYGNGGSLTNRDFYAVQAMWFVS